MQKNYPHKEQISVKLIGSGRDHDYSLDGFSHWASEDKQVMKVFGNIVARWPNEEGEIPELVKKMIKSPKPWYMNLKR